MMLLLKARTLSKKLLHPVNLPGASEGKLFNFISRACPPDSSRGDSKERRWGFYFFICFAMTLLLCSCLPGITPIAPTPMPLSTQAVPSATFAYPTIPPTVTRIPFPTPTPTPSSLDELGEVIFEDDFSQDRGWELGEQKIGAISLQSDRLVIAVRQANSFLYSLLPTLALDGFFLEIELRADLCQSGDEFGVMFRVNQDFEHYRYAINCQGAARAVRILSGDSRSLVPLSEFPSIISGPMSTNRLSLMASGDTFQFRINGLEIFKARDVTLTEGALGLFVRSGRANQVTISFDNLRIRELHPIPALTATPTP